MTGTTGSPARPVRVLLTGARQSGKTTCCMAAARLLRERGLRPGGVLCPKLLDDAGGIIGIEVWNLLSDPASREVLARTDRAMDGPRTGMYRFSQRGLRFGREALEAGAARADVLFADELGPLEMRGQGFSNLLDLARRHSTPPMVIVVRTELVAAVSRTLEPFSCLLLELRPENRDHAPPRLLELLLKGP